MKKSSAHKKAPSVAALEASGNEINFAERLVMPNSTTAVSNVIPFRFETKEVRTLLINDQPWFVANDVSAALLYSEASAMTRHLDDDEKGLSIVQTLGGDQEMLVINESGLYSAILRSRKAEAKRFKKWVTAEVLPAIRKTGRYEEPVGRMATLIGQTIGTDGFHMLAALVKGKVSGLPKAVQRRAISKIWSQAHAAFGVRSAADIPAELLDSARNFVAAYVVLEGEYIKRKQLDVQVDFKGSPHSRYLLSLDDQGRQRVELLPHDTMVMNARQFKKAMSTSGDAMIPTEQLLEFMAVAVEKLRQSAELQAARAAA
ncbi:MULTISPECIES: BRO-N domain-containing protein [Pseudomonas syringae group]|uniref:BRO-N domain-containing protein n=1 Tax=Pseudomonas syringae group TaxID=136849 RepID=UPI001EEEB8D6|nr:MULTISPECIES: Bro-N domain-containing protein [Pseudomonas syringae group]MEA1762271.1 Bro-N domain-containing protein [Pseudomonas syringae pv. tomato]